MSINVTARDFDELVLRAEKPVLLDVWAPWCPHCRRIGPAFEQVGEQHGDRLTAAMLNYDEARELADRYGVDTLPTLLLFSGGQVVDALVAPATKAAIEEFVRRALP